MCTCSFPVLVLLPLSLFARRLYRPHLLFCVKVYAMNGNTPSAHSIHAVVSSLQEIQGTQANQPVAGAPLSLLCRFFLHTLSSFLFLSLRSSFSMSWNLLSCFLGLHCFFISLTSSFFLYFLLSCGYVADEWLDVCYWRAGHSLSPTNETTVKWQVTLSNGAVASLAYSLADTARCGTRCLRCVLCGRRKKSEKNPGEHDKTRER